MSDKKLDKLKVSVYYTPECPRETVLDEVKKALEEARVESYEIEEIVLANDDEAREHRILGVPTVRIEGMDVDPNFEDKGVYRSTCTRIYRWGEHLYNYPPKDMIKDALKRLGLID